MLHVATSRTITLYGLVRSLDKKFKLNAFEVVG